MQLFLGLVHYKDQARFKNAQKIFNDLKYIGINFLFSDESWQPSNFYLDLRTILIKEFRQYLLRVRFSIYLKNYREAVREALYFFYFLRRLLRKGAAGYIQQSSIEILVTDKHIRLWQKFTQSDSQFLIIFEDDVCESEHSIDRFRTQVMPIIPNGSEEIYIDLAGGLSGLDLKNPAIIKLVNNNSTQWARPITNTACAYGISKSLCEKFLRLIIKNPHYRLLPIDWLMNQMFIDLKRSKIECIHFNPPVFVHGSTSGNFKSWQSF